MTLMELEPALRLLLAVLFGAIIGVERQWHHKNAGIKTNTLVALGAAGFAMMSAKGFGPSTNPAQLASAVATGIGFIGAGVIIHRGASVQGVNTAATLWANASMGVAMGAGHYRAGVGIFIAVMSVQFAARALSRMIDANLPQYGTEQTFEVRVSCTDSAIDAVEVAWDAFAKENRLVPDRRAVAHDGWLIEFHCRDFETLDLPKFERKLLAVEGVQRVETRRYEGDPNGSGIS